MKRTRTIVLAALLIFTIMAFSAPALAAPAPSNAPTINWEGGGGW